MRVNTKIRYGLRAMMEIAGSTEPGGVLQKDIAGNQDISLKYLDSIISALKTKGLITNHKGKGSGYVLARPAESITMLDIYTAFEPIIVIDCLENGSYCKKSSGCRTKDYWSELKHDFRAILLKKDLASILKESI